MTGGKYGRYVLCCACILLAWTVPVYADEWEMDQLYMEDNDSTYNQQDYLDWWEDYDDYATPSNATSMDADMPVYYGNYDNVYDGTYSSTYLTYARDTVSKMSPDMDYVFFRSGQYSYRLVYADDLSYDGVYFRSTGASYISYDSRYYTISHGREGSFSLRANNYLVYTSLDTVYPTLDSGVRNYEFKTLLFICTLMLLFGIAKSFFSVRKYRI